MCQSEKITVMVVTSSADQPQILLGRNLSGFNRAKLKQDGGNPVRLIQDLLQAYVMHVSNIDDLRRNNNCFTRWVAIGAGRRCPVCVAGLNGASLSQADRLK